MTTLSRLTLLPLEPGSRGPVSDYDRARRALLRYDQVVRRSADRVDRFREQVRRHDARRELAATLPELFVRIQGPAGGLTGIRLFVDGERSEAAQLGFSARSFRADDRELEARPTLEVRLGRRVLDAGVGTAVSVWLDFSATPFGAGEALYGEIEVLADGRVTGVVGVEVELYASEARAMGSLAGAK